MIKKLYHWLSRISGMEWWNGILEWNTEIGQVMPKLSYFINTWISDTDYQQGYHQLQERAKDMISPLVTMGYTRLYVQ